MNRPLVPPTLALAAGVLLWGHAAAWDQGPMLILAFAALGFGLTSLWWRKGVFAVCLFAFTAGILLAMATERTRAPGALAHHATASGFPCVIEGTVRSAPPLLPGDEYLTAEISVNRLSTETRRIRSGGASQLRWSRPSTQLLPGDRVLFSGSLSRKLGPENPGVATYADDLRRDGIHTCFKARGAEALRNLEPGPWWSLRRQAARLRRAEAMVLLRAVPTDGQAFALTLWLGDRRRLDANVYATHVRAGTAHILAISGLHVAVFFAFLSALLPICFRNAWVRAGVTAAFLLLLVFTTGGRASVVRAVIMIGAYVTADLAGRERDAPTALAAAVLLFILPAPLRLMDVGFQLSVLSVASLILFQGPLSSWMPERPRWFWQLLSAALAVQILPFPVVASAFHVVPLASPLANVIAVPLAGVGVCLAMFTAASGLFYAPAAALFGAGFWVVAGLLQGTASVAASLPGMTHRIAAPGLLAGGLTAGVLLAMAYAFYGRAPRRALAVALLCAVGTAAFWGRPPPRTEAVFLDVGHGDATVVHTNLGGAVLIDAGDSSEYVQRGARTVTPYLLQNGLTRLEAVVATHMDRDHAGGMAYVLENLRVGMLMLPYHATERPLEKRLLAISEARGVPVRRLAAGDAFTVGSVRFEVLHPPQERGILHSINDLSLAIRVVMEDDASTVSFLLPGDIEGPAEAVLATKDCQATVLKAPHHGSATSSSKEFLRAVSPQAVVVSTGGSRGREAVDKGVLARYTALEVPVFRTDLAGGIRLSPVDGGILAATTLPRGRTFIRTQQLP